VGPDASISAEAVAPATANRYLTAPNAFTFVRLLCIPLFLYVLLWQHHHDSRAHAGFLLGMLGATDWVDGWLARKLHQSSEFGKVFDPTVDRIMFIVAIIAIMADGSAPLWFLIAVLAREAVFGGTVAICTLLFHMKRFDVTYLGKTATFLLMFAIPGFVMSNSSAWGTGFYTVASWILAIPGLALSYWTAITYIPVIRASLRAGRAQAAGGTSDLPTTSNGAS
jgi:cardiolipin synthase